MTTETIDTTAVTDITALPPADRAVIVLNSTQTERDLRAMVEEASTITEVKDKTAREQAHRAGMKLKTARTTIEKTGKAAREDAQAFRKAVIDESKRLIAITEAEEKRVLGLRDTFDAEVRRAEEERERIEAARKAEIRQKIEGIRALLLALAGASSDEIAAERDALAAFTPPEDVFGEFTEECREALSSAVQTLGDLYNQAMARETAAAAVEAERQRMEQAKAEADKQLAAERAAMEEERAAIARERAELEALRAEQAALKAPKFEPVVIGVDLAGGPDVHVETEVVELRVPVEVAAAVEADPEGAVQALEDAVSPLATAPGETLPTASDWKIRRAALATADQFSALAQKVQACGFGSFANTLLDVAGLLRNGDHDSAIAQADHLAMIEADNAMLDATVNCVEALAEEQAEAA